MTRYKQRKDGEGFEAPVGEVYRLACCDCGLVHDVVWVIEDGKLGMAAKRNNRATAQRRRQKLTPWFNGTVKPVRVGVYQRKYHDGVWFCWWDGKNWRSALPDKYQCETSPYSGFQDMPWRGLAK